MAASRLSYAEQNPSHQVSPMLYSEGKQKRASNRWDKRGSDNRSSDKSTHSYPIPGAGTVMYTKNVDFVPTTQFERKYWRAVLGSGAD